MPEQVVFTNSRGVSVTIRDGPPYMLNAFDLGAPKSTLITTKAPGQDGKTLEGQTLEERTPSITMYIKCPASELDERRRFLYSVFNPKLGGTLQYTNDAGSRTIACAVQDEPIAKAKAGQHQQFLIQLFCPDPYWCDTSEILQHIAQWVPDFYFPLSIPMNTGVTLGHRISNLIVNCFNPGDADCGLRVEFTALATVKAPSIININTREFIKLKPTLPLVAGDKLIIDTAFGHETVRKIHGTENTNALNYIDLSTLTTQDDLFFYLHTGDNILRYDAESGLDNLECAIYYTPKYMGA